MNTPAAPPPSPCLALSALARKLERAEKTLDAAENSFCETSRQLVAACRAEINRPPPGLGTNRSAAKGIAIGSRLAERELLMRARLSRAEERDHEVAATLARNRAALTAAAAAFDEIVEPSMEKLRLARLLSCAPAPGSSPRLRAALAEMLAQVDREPAGFARAAAYFDRADAMTNLIGQMSAFSGVVTVPLTQTQPKK
ncbi:MAG: hypothetical protein ABMA13_01190 [Chthoniobacteraceae bacterium]